MKILYELTLIFNILVILVFTFGLFYKFKEPKRKAIYGYVMASAMIPYMILLAIITLLGVVFLHSINILYLICLVSPFVIGKLVRLETLKKYTVLQILFFCISLIDIFFAMCK